jgi:PTS system nitrogen regulatory IIA component
MYLNLIQIAESFGVSESVVEGWIRVEGMPHTPDRGRVLFDRAQVVQWAAARGLATRAGFLTPQNSAFATDCQLEPLLRAGGIWRDVPAAEVFGVLTKVIGQLPGVTPPIRQLLAQRLGAVGGITWAAIGGGMALPHPSARIALGRESGTVAVILLREPLSQAGPTPDEVPVTKMFFFIAPSPRAHLDLLGRLTRALAQGNLRRLVGNQASDVEIFAAAAAADAASANPNKATNGNPEGTQ